MEFKISKELEDYQNSINFMDSHINNMISNKKEDLIWLLEYPNIYTYGPLSKKKDLLEPEKFPVIPSERGGQYTYHGPGQRVVYLMINLREKSKDINYELIMTEINDYILIDDIKIEVKSIIHKNSTLEPIVFLHEGLGSVALWKNFPREIYNLTKRPYD